MRHTTTRLRMLATGLALLGLGTLMTACSETTKVQPAVGSVVVTPDVVSLQTGDTLRLTVTVLDAKGDTLTRTVTLASSDETIATVDTNGLVTAVAPGTVTITVTCEDKVVTITVTVDVPVAAVTVAARSTELEVGDTVMMDVTVKDEDGNTVSRKVTWATSDPTVATVDETGKVTAVGMGTVTITATSHGKMGSATVTVAATAATIEITGATQRPVMIDSTLQLTAVVKNAQGTEIQRSVRWSSSDASIATVDDAGLVTGVDRGTATITATAGKVSASVSVRVVGESSGVGNNLSYPVVFAEGHGIGGLPLTTGTAGDTATGLRPLTAEAITVDALPFWYDGNAPDYENTYFMQQGANTWQAQWTAASTPVHAEAAFGDNLLGHTWNTHSQIRVEVALYDYAGTQLTGYNMTSLYGDKSTEMQGTDGSTGLFTPTIYAVSPRLVIQKLNEQGGQPTYTAFDQSIAEGGGIEGPGKFGAEVNVSGKIVYGYNLTIRNLALPEGMLKYGWWRITFELDETPVMGGAPVTRNVVLDSVATGGETETPLYTPQLDAARNRVWVDVYIESASGGGGGEH